MNINCAVYTSSPLEKKNIVLPAFIYKKVKKASGSKSLTHQPDVLKSFFDSFLGEDVRTACLEATIFFPTLVIYFTFSVGIGNRQWRSQDWRQSWALWN